MQVRSKSLYECNEEVVLRRRNDLCALIDHFEVLVTVIRISLLVTLAVTRCNKKVVLRSRNDLSHCNP